MEAVATLSESQRKKYELRPLTDEEKGVIRQILTKKKQHWVPFLRLNICTYLWFSLFAPGDNTPQSIRSLTIMRYEPSQARDAANSRFRAAKVLFRVVFLEDKEGYEYYAIAVLKNAG